MRSLHTSYFRIVVGAAIGLGLLFCATPVYAADCGGIETSIVDCASAQDTTGSPVVAILVVAIQILTGLIGIAAIGAFIYAGIVYTSAGDNVSQTAKAKEIMMNTVIGLIVFAAMGVLLNYLIPGGLFSGSAKFGAGGNGKSKIADTLNPGAGTSNETDPTAKNNPTSTLKLSIGSWNVYKLGKQSSALSGIATLVKEVDILGIQEAGNYATAINNSLANNFAMYPTSKSEPRKIAILYNKTKLSVLSKGYFNGGYQPEFDLQRQFVWIKFKEKGSGKVFYIINTHFPHASGEEKNGMEYYNNDSNGKAWAAHMKKLVAKVSTLQKEGLPIFITGDINFDYRSGNCTQPYSPCVALAKKLAVKSGWEYTRLKDIGNSAGTASSSRVIDYVFSWQQSNVTYQSMSILHGGSGRNGWSGSDHKPVALKLTIGKE